MNAPTQHDFTSIQPEMIAAIDRLIAKVGVLHSGPDVARALLDLTKTSDYDVQAVVDCLERDPAMAAKILRLVNSSRFALRRQVTNLRQAVTFVGQKTLRLVAMTFSLVDVLTRGAPRELYNDYWRRSISAASVANRLVAYKKSCDPHDAYAAGLLSDLGILMFAQAASKDYCSIYHLSKKAGNCLIEAERVHFGFDHAMLAWRLLKEWGFPEPLCNAVLHHHDPACASQPLAVAARAGDLMTDVIWTQPSARVAEAMSWLDHFFGVDIDLFTDLALNTREEITREAEIYGVTLATEIDAAALRARAASQFKQAAIETGQNLDQLVARLQGTAAGIQI